MSAWHDYKMNKIKKTSIAIQLDTERKKNIEKNRHYIKAVIEIVLFCSLYELPLRGHDESCDSSNKGNFCELVKLVANHDSVVSERLSTGPRNATYRSPEIQNCIINILATMVRTNICSNVREATFFP